MIPTSFMPRQTILLVTLALLSLVIGCSDKRIPPTLSHTHPTAWMDPASLDFHGTVIMTTGTASCRVCHATDLSGGRAGVGCDKCHGPGKGTSCIGCHGGTDNNTGAPPKSLRGYTSTDSIPVGAHTMHLSLSADADSFLCSSCHVVPMYTWDSTHLDLNIVTGQGTPDSVAEVTFHGLGLADGATWNHSTATCRLTYCHGNFAGGDTSNAPHWTAPRANPCGTCHDIGTHPTDLQGLHPLHIDTYGLTCVDCHAGVVNDSLRITDRSRHVNGTVDTLTANATTCSTCHAATPASCTHCHGRVDNQTGAPPRGLHGETATTTLAVGAHTKHLVGGAISGPMKCSDCHLSYTYVTDPGHFALDSIAELVWGGFANKSGGATWDRSTQTCSQTYCHGNFSGGRSANTPRWISANQAACGSCHDNGVIPNSLGGLHLKHSGEGVACWKCHSATLDSNDQIVGKNVHIDGINTVVFWNSTGSWDQGTRTCTNPGGCHDDETW